MRNSQVSANWPVLVDSNLLVLHIAGSLDPGLVGEHKRLRNYDLEALTLLNDLLASAREILTTSHILAETSNLLRQIRSPLDMVLTECLGNYILNSNERMVDAVNLVPRAEFRDLGVADTGIVEAASPESYVLTDDLRLYLRLARTAIKAVNFTHVREHGLMQ